jgi:hypothetical protein
MCFQDLIVHNLLLPETQNGKTYEEEMEHSQGSWGDRVGGELSTSLHYYITYINCMKFFLEELDIYWHIRLVILQTYEFSSIILYFTNKLPFLTYVYVLRKLQIIFILFHVQVYCYFAVYKYFCMTSNQLLNIFTTKQP